ncbi:UNVERIFIED_CONTAM: hypothetical protein Scaly_2948700 [Sesamum calycinum]|uniref:Reverse transcriptase Ty1/copia-type domain-containing protein n=1 Tax=Sesamum calycinum TaxID=2727403 RepID=A0AAW2KUE7_9LAMI
MIHPSKIFISRNAVFLKKSFSLDNRRDEVLLEESSEPPQQNNTTSLEPSFPTDGVPFLCISTRESRLPERYGFVGLTSQLDNDPKTYGEAMSDIDSDKWLEAMKSKMDSIDSNQVWTLVDPPKGIKPVVCKWVYNHKLQADGEVTAFKARLMMDVKMAFLNDYVEEDIFMDQSEDFTSVGEEQKAIVTPAFSLTMTMPSPNRGFVFKLNGGVVAWKSSKQATTSDSTTEAEYITTSEVVWMKNYIQELGVVPSIAEPVVIFCDNNRAITQAKNRDLIPFQTHS